LVTKEAGGGAKQSFYVKDGRAYAVCGQGVLRVVRFELDGIAMNAAEFAARFGTQKFEFNC
jgi:methionyl-tRNA formyltransferase